MTKTVTTWRKSIIATMKENGESWEMVEANTLSEEDLDVEFSNDYGGEEGKSFTMWTSQYVYFPLCYDGLEWCGSVSRHPNGKPTGHQGG